MCLKNNELLERETRLELATSTLARPPDPKEINDIASQIGTNHAIAINALPMVAWFARDSRNGARGPAKRSGRSAIHRPRAPVIPQALLFGGGRLSAAPWDGSLWQAIPVGADGRYENSVRIPRWDSVQSTTRASEGRTRAVSADTPRHTGASRCDSAPPGSRTHHGPRRADHGCARRRETRGSRSAPPPPLG